MIKIAVISKRVKEYITLPEEHEYEMLNSSDIKADIVNRINSSIDKPLITAFFCHIDEFHDINNQFRVLPYSDIAYQFILFGSGKELESHKFNAFLKVSDIRSSEISGYEFDFIVKKTFTIVMELYENSLIQDEYLNKLIDARIDQEDLINIGRSLSSEKNQENLLRLILSLSKKITGADAGSIYLVEEDENGGKRLRFKYSHTFSREIPLEEFVMDINKRSIAGYVAVTGEVLNIPDAYQLSEDTPYSFNSSFDEQHNYICRSMLVVPMRNHVDEIIGVIQLINSKEDLDGKADPGNVAYELRLEEKEDFNRYVRKFNEKYNSLMQAIAGQAAVAIENSRMIEQIQYQFEEFVKASVTAIESRDPATSGHSFRVAEICKAMAEAVNKEADGYYKDYKFNENDIREIEFAALLHDFGKVYIDLSVITGMRQ